ncbi:hypothetical protein [Catenuloplanes japonicus]|uniref:hypothetical protein n=1 Tax=Catenuloplanes japonicus TaxID=33876 RepID=UPI000A515C63|nr:hypothetical protein [Catenuloplanes japonicus]
MCVPAMPRRVVPAVSVPADPQRESVLAGQPALAYLTWIPSSPGMAAGEAPRRITLVLAAL